jgi:signal transduction histidine kinase
MSGPAKKLEDLNKKQLIAKIEHLQHGLDEESTLLRLKHDLHVHQEELVVQNQELKEIGQELEASRNRYAELYDFAPVGYATLDRYSRIEQINLTAVNMLEVDRAQALRMPITRFLPTEARSIVRSLITSCTEDKKKVSAELQLHNGRYVQMNCVPSSALGMSTSLAWTTLTDITIRKEHEQIINESHARIFALIESTDDVIWTIDSKHHIVVSNQSYLEVSDDLLADPYHSTKRQLSVQEEELRLWWRGLYLKAFGGEALRTEKGISLRGVERFYDIAINPIREGDRITGAVIIARDRTEKHDHEIALKLAKEEAESLSKAKSSFLAHIAHEIRTPLNAIISFASLIKENIDEHKLARYSRAIVDNSRRLAETTSELLTLAKLESKSMKANLQPVDALLELERSIELISSLAEKKGLPIKLVCKYSELIVQADPHHFRQIISNLLVNAIKFTEEGGITISVEKTGPREAEIRITDTGIGIDENHLPFIFEEFYQEPLESHDQNLGAGLGLPIVKKLSGLMGAEISAESIKGKGSSFILRVPISK